MRTNILDVAEELLTRHAVRGFIIPANFGTTARAVLDRFGEGYEYFVVGNPSSSHDKGFVYHSGMSDATRTELEELGFTVILQEVSAFQPMNTSSVFIEHARNMQASYERATESPNVKIDGTTLSWIVECTIRALFDEQVKTCVELALMAGESSQVDRAGKYISFCTPSRWSDLRDCAVVLNPSTSADFFQHPPHIYEIAYSDTPKADS